MTVTFSLGPNPKWYFVDLTGLPLGGGYFSTYSALDPTNLKYVYEDPAGSFPWPYASIPNTGQLGILIDENGTQGPFYFEFDSSNPEDSYLLEVYDSNGVLVWTVDTYIPTNGSGGSVISEVTNLNNLITNNIMWRNIGSSASPIASTFTKIALGAHAGLAQTPSLAGPDICFIKNNTSATDQISFSNFPLGPNPFASQNDIAPPFYLNYTCTAPGSGETDKYIQFPITTNVQNFSNVQVTFTIWCRFNSGNSNLTFQWLQFFGDGSGASTAITTPIAMQAVASSWTKYLFTVTIPSLISVTNPSPQIGACGNSGLFLQIQYPLNAATNIDLTSPSFFLGSLAPNFSFQTIDEIESIISSPRTGYVYSSYDIVAPFGYLAMNDGTIGSASSGATTRANIDTFPLYNWLYTNVTIPSSNSLCIVTGYTGNAVNDFSANRVMQLPYAVGRVLSASGIPSTGGSINIPLGDFTGEQTHTLTITEMPSHNHTVSGALLTQSPPGSQIQGGVNWQQNGTITSSSTGGSGAHNNIQPSTYVNYFIKL